jgi:hypothetical protein
MSFMQLLSVGQSFQGLSNAPSPYRISQDNLLPKFAPARRPVQLAPRTLFEGRASASAASSGAARVVGLVPAATVTEGSAVPGELWDQLMVKRNDLHDSDLEVVVASKAEKRRAPRPAAAALVGDRPAGAWLLAWQRMRRRLWMAARSLM